MTVAHNRRVLQRLSTPLLASNCQVPSNTFKKESEMLLPGPASPRVSPGI
jgi:hypothetical protein